MGYANGYWCVLKIGPRHATPKAIVHMNVAIDVGLDPKEVI
jgi:hypothetical protein